MHKHIYQQYNNKYTVNRLHINNTGYILHIRYKNKMKERKNKQKKNKNNNQPILIINYIYCYMNQLAFDSYLIKLTINRLYIICIFLTLFKDRQQLQSGQAIS